MPQLVDLKVDKVSFVRRGANKRRFVLLKSADINNEGEEHRTMNGVIKKKVLALLKQSEHKQKSAEALVNLLKEDADVKKLELKDEDFAEIQASVSLMKDAIAATDIDAGITNDAGGIGLPSSETSEEGGEEESGEEEGAPEGDAAAKSAAIAELRKQNKLLTARIEAQETVMKANDLRSWFAKEAPYAAVDVEKEILRLLKLEKLDKDVFEAAKEALKNTSRIIEKSEAFDEVGTVRGNDSSALESDYFAEVHKTTDEIKKSTGKDLSPEQQVMVIRDAVKKAGPRAYQQYRRDHALQARLGGLRVN